MTPGGLPQKGDRVQALDWVTREVIGRGIVLERGAGDYWSLTVQWDSQQRPTLLVDASWSWDQGTLRLEPSGAG